MAKDTTVEPTQQTAPVMMTYEQFVEMERKREELKSRNIIEFSGMLTELKALPQKAKTDKNGQMVLDEDSNPTFYDPMFWATIAVFGSEEGALLSAEQCNGIEVGKFYLFKGRLKNRKIKVEHVTQI